MATRTMLPLDILLYIIDLLASEDDVDIESLRILSLTCKSMVPLCRKHLFSSLHLHSKLDSDCFNDLLSNNPDIARYVRNLNYRIYGLVTDPDLNIFDMLKKRSSIRSINLSSFRWEWNDIPELIRSSLVSLIQLPTVAQLAIHSFRGLPATALSGCSNLIHLKLRDLTLAPPEVNQVISRCKIPTLVSLYVDERTYGLAALLNSTSLYADGPIIDCTRLQKADFDVASRGDFDQVIDLVKVSTRLEFLSIITISGDSEFNMGQPVWLTGLGACLAINAYRSLRFLALTLTVVGDHHDPLCGLSHELRYIAGNNILEGLELDVVVQEDALCRTDSEDWAAFDSVLTESGAFPMLHRVLVVIWWYMLGMELSEQEVILDSLKEDKFPRLVESKAVEFNFSAESHWAW